MKKIAFFLVLLLIGIGLFVQLILDSGPAVLWQQLLAFSLISFLVFTVISLVNFLVYTAKWWEILRTHGHNVSFWHLFMYRMMGYTMSYLTPMMQVGGEPLRIYFLKRHNVSTKDATSTVIIDKFLELATTIMFVMVGVLIFVSEGLFSGGQMYIVGGSFLLLLAACGLFTYLTIRGHGFFSTVLHYLGFYKIPFLKKYEEKIASMEHKMHEYFVKTPMSLLISTVLSLLTYFVIVLEYWYLMYALGAPVSFGAAFIIATLPSVAYFIPVPGAVGVFEGAQVATFSLLGIEPSLGLVMVLIVRLRDILFLGLGIGFGSYYGFSGLKQQFISMWKRS